MHDVPHRQVQTIAQSCPTGAVDCNAGEISAGSLTIILPFAMQHHTDVVEIYDGDLECTYNSGYTGPPTYAECLAAGYPALLANITAGNIFSTGAATGGARISGSGRVN